MEDMVTLKLNIKMPKRWVKMFFAMLDCMKWCGNVGASRTIAFYADGDGDFRLEEIEVNGKELKTNVDWNKFDKGWTPKDNNELTPRFKTRRSIDFFFDAG